MREPEVVKAMSQNCVHMSVYYVNVSRKAPEHREAGGNDEKTNLHGGKAAQTQNLVS